jgi:hypothetical protein
MSSKNVEIGSNAEALREREKTIDQIFWKLFLFLLKE